MLDRRLLTAALAACSGKGWRAATTRGSRSVANPPSACQHQNLSPAKEALTKGSRAHRPLFGVAQEENCIGCTHLIEPFEQQQQQQQEPTRVNGKPRVAKKKEPESKIASTFDSEGKKKKGRYLQEGEVRIGGWTAPEAALLLHIVEQDGARDWSKVARELTKTLPQLACKRAGNGVRQFYHSKLRGNPAMGKAATLTPATLARPHRKWAADAVRPTPQLTPTRRTIYTAHAETLLFADNREFAGTQGQEHDAPSRYTRGEGDAAPPQKPPPKKRTGGGRSAPAIESERVGAGGSVRSPRPQSVATKSCVAGEHWTPEEDERLRKLVKRTGAKDWKDKTEKLRQYLGTDRTPDACR